jgi:transposase
MRNKQVYLGKLDPETGELIPSKRFNKEPSPMATASTTVIGPTLVLSKVAHDIGLEATLEQVFPASWKQILTLSYFLVCKGDPLVHADPWCRNHEVPEKGSYTSQRLSEWLSSITEDERQTFFKVWKRHVSENDYLCYDITSVSSYSELNEYIRYGYNRDRESLPQVNLAMVLGQMSGLPVTYRFLPGSISDVTSLKKLLGTFEKLEYPKLTLVLDRGFYSQQNITSLFNERYHFIIGLPSNRKWVRSIIDRCQDAIVSPKGYRNTDTATLYMHTELHRWEENNRRCYVHVYYDPHRAAEDFDKKVKHLLVCKEELENGRANPANKEDYERYFVVKETPVRGLSVEYNDEAIREYRNKYAGFFTIMTTKKMDALDALQTYRGKDCIEKVFDDLKNTLDMKRLRIHSSDQMASRLFVQFISLILRCGIQKTMRETKMSEKYSPVLLLEELESLTKIHYAGKYKDIVSEVTKVQRDILEAFGINVNTL